MTEWRGPTPGAGWMDEHLFISRPRGYGKTAKLRELQEHYDSVGPSAYAEKLAAAVGAGEIYVGVDGDTAVVGRKGLDGSVYILSEQETDAYFGIESAIRAVIQARARRHEEFLRSIFRVRIDEPLTPEMEARIVEELESADLPVNFWQSVEAYNMLNDEEGRRLVRAIINRKLGCNVERETD